MGSLKYLLTVLMFFLSVPSFANKEGRVESCATISDTFTPCTRTWTSKVDIGTSIPIRQAETLPYQNFFDAIDFERAQRGSIVKKEGQEKIVNVFPPEEELKIYALTFADGAFSVSNQQFKRTNDLLLVSLLISIIMAMLSGIPHIPFIESSEWNERASAITIVLINLGYGVVQMGGAKECIFVIIFISVLVSGGVGKSIFSGIFSLVLAFFFTMIIGGVSFLDRIQYEYLIAFSVILIAIEFFVFWVATLMRQRRDLTTPSPT